MNPIPNKTKSHWTLYYISALIGFISVIAAIIIGYISYLRSLSIAELNHYNFYMTKAHMLAAVAYFQQDHHHSHNLLDEISQFWQKASNRPRDEYICIVDKDSNLIYHSIHPETVGKNAGKNRIFGKTATQHCLKDLVDQKLDYIGPYISSAGQEQVAAFAYIPQKGWTLGVHRSKKALDQEIQQSINKLGIAFFVFCGILMPISLIMLCIAVHVSRKRHKQAVLEQQKLLEELRQSQKLQSLGQLAGGVAHDFNNMMGAILAYTELLEQSPINMDQHKWLTAIDNTVHKATSLTQKLMSFGRKGKHLIKPVDIHYVLQEVVRILSRTIDKTIKIDECFCQDSCITEGDVAELQNAFLNIALNARDAMPNGGLLTISTQVQEFDKDFCIPRDMIPGKFITIKVKDTGTGIAPEFQKMIFEPFFTTKPSGEGTGLGLASVFGTIKSHKGHIELECKQNKETVFTIFLPLYEGKLSVEEATAPPPSATTTHETVLFVDDEESLTEAISIGLKKLGYNVICFNDSIKALEFYKEKTQKIDLLLLDMVMPKMNGQTLLAEIRKIDPEVKAIIASGFTDQGALNKLQKQGINNFIQKPYKLAKLSKTIKNVLEL